MTRTSKVFFRAFTAVALTSGLVLAQDQPPTPPQSAPPSNGGWRRVGDPPPVAPTQQASPTPAQTDPTEPVDRSDAYGQAPQSVDPQTAAQQSTPPPALQRRSTPQAAPPPYGIPPELTLKQGTFFTIRTNQILSSDKNKSGDLFTGTLTQPLIVNGVVVAQPGELVAGRVNDAGKAKDGKHFIRLGLTSITAADGTQIPVHTELAQVMGGRTPGEIQAGTVVGTTAAGGLIGGIAGWGTGAAIGAGAGAAVGLAAIFATRNHPAVIFPETALTFQITSPVTISTVNAPQAFRYSGPQDYYGPQGTVARAQPRPYPGYPGASYAPGYGYPAPYPYYGPAYYPYPVWGPSFGVVVGRGWGWGGWGRRW